MTHTQAPLNFIEKYYTDDLSERDTKEAIWSLRWLKNVSGDNVLSVGCGPNFYDDVQFFANIPKHFVGIDINQNNIEFLKTSKHPELLKWKRFLNEQNVDIGLIINDIKEERGGFVRRFDAIYAIGVLGMFSEEDTSKIFNLLNSYLKKDGKLIDIDWTEPYLPKEKLEERKNYEWYSKQGPSIQRIGNIMKEAGFEILKHEVYNVPDPKSYSWEKIYAYVAKK